MLPKLRVAVLMGGISGERQISISTGRQILAALDPDKYITVAADPASLQVSGRSLLPQDDDAIPPLHIEDWISGANRPDVVFIALHGRGGEDGAIQGLLELLGIPYTGSGVLASAMAMDKVMTKRVLRSDGIPVPEDLVIGPGQQHPVQLTQRVGDTLGYPVIVKPSREGSTIGCSIVRAPDELAPAVDEALRYDSDVIIETYLRGVEITAGLIGNRNPEVLPLIEIVPKGGFYDFEAKYAPGGSQHIIPARISGQAAELARDYARRTHCLLGCHGMSRVDMIVVGDQPYVLETNTIPGMTPTSLLPDAARAAGITFPELLDRIIQLAIENCVSDAG